MMTSNNHVPMNKRQTTADPDTSPVRVFIVEDEDEVRAGLCNAIIAEHQLQLVGDARLYKTSRRWLADGRHPMDILLLDLGLPDGSGLDLISDCRQFRPDASIMVMTMFGDERHVFEALERGATGYLLKSTCAEMLTAHLLEMYRGGSPITPTVARMIIKRMSPAVPALHHSNQGAEIIGSEGRALSTELLSARERDVLNQIAVGYNTHEIAQRLNISIHTVTAHIRRVYQKLEVHSRSAAVFEGHRRGLIRTPHP